MSLVARAEKYALLMSCTINRLGYVLLSAGASGDQILDELEGWSCGAKLWAIFGLDLFRHDSRSVLGVQLVALVYVYPPQFVRWATSGLEAFFPSHFPPNLHLLDNREFLRFRCFDPALSR